MSFSIGWTVLVVLSLVVVTSWFVMGTKFAQEQSKVEPAPKVKAKATATPSVPSNEVLKKMTKAKIEEVGRELGIELDKRMTKANMIAELKAK